MKKLYTTFFTLAVTATVFAQSPANYTELPTQSTVIGPVQSLNNTELKGGFNGATTPMASTFSKYLDRATAFNMPAINTSSGQVLTTRTAGLASDLGVNFDNSANVNIDRVAVMFSGIMIGTLSQNFDISIYNRNASDSLPTGSAIATVPFTVSQVSAPDLNTNGGLFDFTQFTLFTFTSPVNVTGPFCVSINIDDTIYSAGTKDRLFVATNGVANGDGNNEKRIFTRPLPQLVAANPSFQMQWYKQETFWQVWGNAPGPITHNCDLIIVPLVVGESSVVSSDEIFGKVNGLIFNGHYPNPATENITISYTLEKPNKEVNIKVYDIRGRVVADLKHENVDAGKNSFKINTDGFASGEYIYTLKNDDGKISSHFIVVK